MKKALFQGLIIVFVFLGTWLILSQIDWVNIFKIRKITDKTEKELGELFWEVFKKSEEENKNPNIINPVDSILTQICNANKIKRAEIKLHILNKDEINAFALPNGHLLVYTGLIKNCESPEELTGVISHEIAHIELNHVMKKLVREIGLSVLISMTTGNGGTEIIKETARMLSSTAFDRNLEKEADLKAVDYMINAEVNPVPFANFLYRLSEKDSEATKYLTWISTHPESKERADYILEYNKNNLPEFKPILSQETWEKMKEEVKN
jgi:beta-barrel assembly-enhancing protease